MRALLLTAFLCACTAQTGKVGGGVDATDAAFDMGARDEGAIVFTLNAAHDAGQVLGEATATLATSGGPGVWVSAPFLKGISRGVVIDIETGASVAAELRPSGRVAQMSSEAYRALKVNPNEIRTIRIQR